MPARRVSTASVSHTAVIEMRGTDGGRDVVPGFDESRVSDASATGTCIVNSAELSPAVPATSSIAVVYQPSVTWKIVLPDTRGASEPNAAGGFGQRPHGSHIWSQASVAQPLGELGELGAIGLIDEEDRPSVLGQDGGRFGNGDKRAAGAHKRHRTLADVTPDHVEHHTGLAASSRRSVSASTNSSTPRSSARSQSTARPVPITREAT